MGCKRNKLYQYCIISPWCAYISLISRKRHFLKQGKGRTNNQMQPAERPLHCTPEPRPWGRAEEGWELSSPGNIPSKHKAWDHVELVLRSWGKLLNPSETLFLYLQNGWITPICTSWLVARIGGPFFQNFIISLAWIIPILKASVNI